MLELLIKNAEIIDGMGNPVFIADVGIANQHIARIATNISQDTNQTIIADGLILSPGFIDPHMHSDLTVFGRQGKGSSIHQGVTTEIIGNCGMSAAPLNTASLADLQALSMGIDIKYNWKSMADYLDCLKEIGIINNIVPLVGHSNVRNLVMGSTNQKPTTEQQQEMGKLVEEAMEQGARGFSTGLFYPPGFFANTDEIISLAKVAGKHGGIYPTHIRNESDQVLTAADEAIEIGLKAEIKVEYSHAKLW